MHVSTLLRIVRFLVHEFAGGTLSLLYDTSIDLIFYLWVETMFAVWIISTVVVPGHKD